MTPDQIPPGAHITLDANVLVYHFLGQSAQCSEVLARCQSGELRGYCPAHTRLEVLHRLMTLEAVQNRWVTGNNPARRLSSQPDKIRNLRFAHRDFSNLGQMGVASLDLDSAVLERTPYYSILFGLLANDAALLAAMEVHSLNILVTADAHLTDIPPFQVYGPDDLSGAQVYPIELGATETPGG